jgi:membrane fusion protein, multidrug efflux system
MNFAALPGSCTTRTALALTLMTTLLLQACNSSDKVTTAAPTPVRIAAVMEGPALPPIQATGVVAARDELRLSFKSSGLVQRVTVRAGERVRKGQLLATLDPTEIGAQVEQARQMADKAERDLARGEALQADQVIALEQLQNLRTQADIARAQLRAARFNQQYATITAPADGVVLRRMIEERELVAAGQVVLMLSRDDSGHVVRFAVADRDIVQLRRGDAVEVHLDAWPAQSFPAKVSQVASAADVGSGLFAVEATLEATPHQLVSGLAGQVRLWPHTDAPTLAHVPIGAVLEGNGHRAQVFIAAGNIARRRDIEVAFITPDSVAIRSGIAVGENVIVTGAPYLWDGGPIAIVP